MNQIMSELYSLANDRVSNTPGYQEKIRALATAKLAVLNELENLTEKDIGNLLDVYTSLDAERQELHEQMIFKAALELGLELGKLGFTA